MLIEKIKKNKNYEKLRQMLNELINISILMFLRYMLLICERLKYHGIVPIHILHRFYTTVLMS